MKITAAEVVFHINNAECTPIESSEILKVLFSEIVSDVSENIEEKSLYNLIAIGAHIFKSHEHQATARAGAKEIIDKFTKI